MVFGLGENRTLVKTYGSVFPKTENFHKRCRQNPRFFELHGKERNEPVGGERTAEIAKVGTDRSAGQDVRKFPIGTVAHGRENFICRSVGFWEAERCTKGRDGVGGGA